MAQKLSTPDDKKRLLHYGVQPEMQKRRFGLIAIAKIIYNQLLVTNPAVDRADCEADLTDAIEVSGPASAIFAAARVPAKEQRDVASSMARALLDDDLDQDIIS